MNINILVASNSSKSINLKLGSLIKEVSGVTTNLRTINDFEVPIFSFDTNTVPPKVDAFNAWVKKSDGLIIVCPEYNHSMPGVLKNLLDWSFVKKEAIWSFKPVFLASTSTSKMGGYRALATLKIVLESTKALVFNEFFTKENGMTEISDAKKKNLQELIVEFTKFINMVEQK
jgi:NAD(P)H-dependent FMN reductase